MKFIGNGLCVEDNRFYVIVKVEEKSQTSPATIKHPTFSIYERIRVEKSIKMFLKDIDSGVEICRKVKSYNVRKEDNGIENFVNIDFLYENKEFSINSGGFKNESYFR